MKLPPVLQSMRSQITEALRGAFGELSPELRAVVDYHMGWRDAAGNPVDLPSSKGVRPGLALLAAAAADTNEIDSAVAGAVAVEALHNCAFLLDDVMDGDRYRRQRHTAWVIFGEGMSTLAGTALYVQGQIVLRNSGTPYRDRAIVRYQNTFATMLAGQAIDLQMEGANEISLSRCLLMTEQKTASLMSCATTLGAILAGGPDQTIGALRRYGECLGMAFQARDDLLGIWGEPHQTGGRPKGFDLRARKTTIPVAFALEAGGAAASKLRAILEGSDLDEAKISTATKLVEECGGDAKTTEYASSKVHEALAEISNLNLTDEVRLGFEEVAKMGLPEL